MFVVGKVKVCIKVVLFRGIQQNARPARLARMLRGRVQLLAIVRMRIRQKTPHATIHVSVEKEGKVQKRSV